MKPAQKKQNNIDLLSGRLNTNGQSVLLNSFHLNQLNVLNSSGICQLRIREYTNFF